MQQDCAFYIEQKKMLMEWNIKILWRASSSHFLPKVNDRVFGTWNTYLSINQRKTEQGQIHQSLDTELKSVSYS